MESPTVSVLVPCYQDGDYLRQTLESVLQQSFEDYEIVISDEGVDPICKEICNELSRNDPRIKYFSNKQRLGMTKNWNAALERSCGKYVIKLDGDDQFENKILEKLVKGLNSEPLAGVAACLSYECNQNMQCNEKIYGERGYHLAGINPFTSRCFQPSEIYPFLFADVQLWHSCALMFRRETMNQLSGWDERWGCASDTDIILRLFNEGFTLSHVGYTGLKYRRRENSVSDIYRKNNMLILEGALIHLLSVEKWYRAGNKLTKPLSIGWYRYWRRLNKLKNELLVLDESIFYKEIANKLIKPPLRVIFKEYFRYIANKLKIFFYR